MHEDTQEGSRVSAILSNLATSMGEQSCESSEPWCPEPEPEWVGEVEEATRAQTSPSWQVFNSNSAYDERWADGSDGIQVQWADLAREGVLEDSSRQVRNGARPSEFRAHAPIEPGTGKDGFRASGDLDEEWTVALSEGRAAVTEADVEKMADTLDDLVGTRLGKGLRDSIGLLETALRTNSPHPLELPQGTAEIDIAWELHRELEWNTEFKATLLTHLGLDFDLTEQELLQALLDEVAFCRRRNPGLKQLQRRFQHLVRQTLERNIELVVCEADEEDPFVSYLRTCGVSVQAGCLTDILCSSLEEIGC